MFSIIFFVFVAFILLAGFLVVTTRRNKRRNSTAGNNLSNTTTPESARMSGFNETRSDDIKGRVVPTQMPLNDLNIEGKSDDGEEPGNRPAS